MGIDLAKSVVWGKPAPEVARAMEWLEWMDWSSLAVGRHDLDGEKLFAIVDEYTSKPPERCRLEAHRRYHDIQLLLAGCERIGVARLQGLAVTEPYDEASDVGFFDGPYESITLEVGQAAVFAPSDAHMPQMAAGEPGRVRKVVVKVAVEGDGKD